MSNKKKRKKKSKKKIQNSIFFRSFIGCVITAAVIFVFAFCHYDIVNPAERESYDVVISDIKYDSYRGKAWATFDASGKRSYFIFEEKRYAENDFEKLERLANEKTHVSVTYTNYKDWANILFITDREQVVEIKQGDDVIFGVQAHNESMSMMRILWSVIASIVLAFGIVQLIIYIKFER